MTNGFVYFVVCGGPFFGPGLRRTLLTSVFRNGDLGGGVELGDFHVCLIETEFYGQANYGLIRTQHLIQGDLRAAPPLLAGIKGRWPE